MRDAGLFVMGAVTLTPTDDGGRRGPMGTGNPHQALFDRSSKLTQAEAADVVFHDCVIDLLDSPELDPGSTAPCRVYPHAPEYWRTVGAGRRLGLYEGIRRIGWIDVETGLPTDKLDVWLQAIRDRDNPADLNERVARVRAAVRAYRRRPSRDIKRR